MKTNNWVNEISEKSTPKETKTEVKNNAVCSRTYNEETPFSQINFQTYQDILTQRNELLGNVKHY